MPNIPSLKDMLKAGMHFGHRTSRWHPKMKPFIFGSRSGVHVIDIEQTQKMLENALNQVEEIVSRGGKIMFVGTKPQAQAIVEKYAKEAGMPYVNTRWLGGTFTNFPEIQNLIKNYLDLKDKREKGELRKYTKLEQLQFDRKIDELEGKIGGISTLEKLPEAMFALDVKSDKTAITEARKRGVKVISICDTNVNPTLIDVVIPANDDSTGSLTMITKLVAEAVKVGKARAKSGAVEVKKAVVAKSVAVVEEDDVKVSAESIETVEELDDAMKERQAREQLESMK
ncbi:MAG: 30S ribosomal protein S2 [Candidatus Uhrbacteria bacterium]|nr:30S ribosomal protein S2 [Candidatus Uhrbacteria bacterium]